MGMARRHKAAAPRRSTALDVQWLESRALLTTVSVSVGQVIRQVETQLLGVNVNTWDSYLNTPQTQQMVEAAGLKMFRLPGGSASDDFHFNDPASYNGEGTAPSMASMIASVNGQAIVTLDYGSGSPQEAAAFLAYFDAPVGNTTAIGDGQEWNDTTSAWDTVNWQTAGYWASLRASAPLSVDDGFNFLRLDHPSPFNFQYFEVGNEEYGSWETDHHTVEHDPTTYIAFAKQFATYAAQIAPGISIGVDTGSPSTSDYNDWIGNILQQSVDQGFVPGFLSDHNYMQDPGNESDSNLLFDTDTDPASILDWSVRSTDYEALLSEYFGSSSANVELLATEFNSVSYDPGKQTTSLVNGLFVADALGTLMETAYDGALVWDLRNGYDTGENNSSSLYGWREGGDYGLIGSDGSAPATGDYVPYPTYFAEQLASLIIQPGGQVVQAISDDSNISSYAVLEPDGHLDLLIINKSSSSAIAPNFDLTGFSPGSTAQVWQYGEAQDTAQSESSTGQSALANFTLPVVLSGSSFSETFPAYSMTVIDIAPASSSPSSPVTPTPVSGPTIVSPAASSATNVFGTFASLSVLATDSSALVYTWSTVGNPPALVSFSTNGSSGSNMTTATFHAAGMYQFLVTVTDTSHLSVTSAVTVIVNPSLTSIRVVPQAVVLPLKATETFTAEALDQFGDALARQPAFTWSVIGKGRINQSGAYRAPAKATKAIVRAEVGHITGTSDVTVARRRRNLVEASIANDVSTLKEYNLHKSTITFAWPDPSTQPRTAFPVHRNRSGKLP